MNLICIDAGHGGSDVGATRKGIHEKDLTLDISLKLESVLDYWSNYNTILTRRTDRYVGLTERANIANQYKADIFISIHINSFTSNTVDGLETFFFPGSHRGYALAATIQYNLIKNTEYPDRGIKPARFTVLRKTRMPAVMPELGFLSNRETRTKLQKDHIQFIKSLVIAQSIEEYFNKEVK